MSPDSRPDAASERERQAEQARQKLAEVERRAEEALAREADELEALTERQEKTAERLRKESRELTGPLLPQGPEHEG